MNMGMNFSEIAVILVLVLIFFGSKEIPNIIRQAARFVGKVRMYSEKVKKEINEISKIDEVMPTYDQEVAKKKDGLRARFIAKRKELSPEDRAAKSAVIWENLKRDPLFLNAKAVMVYVEVGAEVAMRPAIAEMFASGKRVILPYTNEDATLGLAEITDLEKDISLSGLGVYEPVFSKRKNFFKSDLQFIMCPAVAFDIYGGRLGRGKGCYDRFCKELKGRVHMYGLAFSCQIMGPDERLPFSYHDIVMDQVITENGALISPPEQTTPSQIEPPAQLAG